MSMKDKMATGVFGRATKYGRDGPSNFFLAKTGEQCSFTKSVGTKSIESGSLVFNGSIFDSLQGYTMKKILGA